MACICDTIPRALKGYAIKERRHPPGKSTRHMHINRRGALLYRVEWGTDKQGERFVSVQPDKKADKQFVKDIERWVAAKFDELTIAHDRAIKGLSFTKVQWAKR